MFLMLVALQSIAWFGGTSSPGILEETLQERSLPRTLADSMPFQRSTIPMASEIHLPAPLPAEEEQAEGWDVRLSMGIRAVEWLLLGAHKRIRGNGSTWNVRADDALGGEIYLAEQIGHVWLEKYFDDCYVVLGSSNRISFRSLGFNLGYEVASSKVETLGVMLGPVLTYVNAGIKEGGVHIPGQFARTWGGQVGIRYSKEFSSGGDGAPAFGWNGEAAFRYVPLKFVGDPGVSNQRMNGSGFILSLGIYVRF